MRRLSILILAILAYSSSFSQTNTIVLSADLSNDCNPLTRIRLYQPGTTILEFEAFEVFNSEDELTITEVPAGNFDLFIRPENYLQKGIPGVEIFNGATIEIGQFVNGDITDDNQINIGDFSIFSGAFPTEVGDPGYVASADLNCNGVINIADFSIFSASYGNEGDEPPLGNLNFDCPNLNLNVGDECDDGDPNTINDLVLENCTCAGELVTGYPEETVHCLAGGAEVVEVLNPETGRIWMDRNLGASQVATSFDDSLAYGDLYQWGRFSDGHQCRDSETTSAVSSSPQPGHGEFITTSGSPNDWLSPQNDNLWQGVNGINNPCPEDYRLATEAELNEERLSWSTNDRNGAFNSPLKLPASGFRNYGSGDLGPYGSYWSSTVSGLKANRLGFDNTDASVSDVNRAYGASVRCIKDGSTSIFDCPELELNIGDPCDDGNPDTENDAVNDNCECEGEVAINPEYPEGTVHCLPGGAEIVEVINPETGKTWMDRNLGASQVATSVTDEEAYGDLYQWGRFSDGHQCRDSESTNVISSSEQPGHDDFIISNINPSDWLSPQNDGLWQAVSGINNPCPDSFRLPTSAELNSERLSWDFNTSEGAFGSPLKLPKAGNRVGSTGNLFRVDTYGYYWSHTASLSLADYLIFNDGFANMNSSSRAFGISVRCIKDECPLLDLNIGAPCDDEDANTINDIITESCECEGELVVNPDYPEGSVHCILGGADVVEVFNPETGRVWMDRNLGASQVATASDDELAYGDLYQWGRFSDGHQCRDSETTSTLSSTPQPGHGDFILSSNSSSWDWLNPQNNDLWQGTNGENNPCPESYRIPTEAELNFERLTWETNDIDGAFNSPLKFTVAGSRSVYGTTNAGFSGRYWSSTISTSHAANLYIWDFNESALFFSSRGSAMSVRCIKSDYCSELESYVGDPCNDNNPNTINDFVAESCECEGVLVEIPDYPDGTVHCLSGGAEVIEVMNPLTGQVWMDRNLGASQVATFKNDPLARGDSYQWGRFSDGHQCTGAGTTDVISSSPQPGHDDVILAYDYPEDWLSPPNDNLWQGADGENNPCPEGFRVPTSGECGAERDSWLSMGEQNGFGAFNSPLRFVEGYYWTSSTQSPDALHLAIGSSLTTIWNSGRRYRFHVRCIKD